jgi:transglutaminase-like putative cysteine protease
VIYDIRHDTTFNYAQPVSVSHQLLRLAPRPTPRQQALRHQLIIEPAPSLKETRQDYFGNDTTYITVQLPHERLTVRSLSRVEVQPVDAGLLDLGPCWEDVAAALDTPADRAALEASQFAFASPYVAVDDAVDAFARQVFTPAKPLPTAAMELTSKIYREFQYEGGVTDVFTPVSEVLTRRRGVCQDFAHLEIAALRSLGLAARYMSGYLLTHAAAGRERLVGADASHAWIAVWCPPLGWIEFDPTNNLMPSDEHIVLAWGRDYGDVSPTAGIIVGGGAHTVEVAVNVEPVAV